MQYDQNGYPIKGSSNNLPPPPQQQQQQQYGQPQYQHHQHQQQREYENSATNSNTYQYGAAAAASSSSPQYDANGHPIKPNTNAAQNRNQQPYQQPYQQPQQQQYYDGPRYDASGNPIKMTPVSANAVAAGGGGGGVPSYAGGGGVGAAYGYQPYTDASGSVNANNNNQQPQYHYPQGGVGVGGVAPNGAGVVTIPPPPPPPLPPLANVPQYWKSGLCDVTADCDVCLEVCFCHPCQEARVYNSIRLSTNDSMNCPICCIGSMTNWFGLYPIVNLCNRRAIIKKYNLQDEGCCTSFCFALCCPMHSTCQMQRELQSRGLWPGGQCLAKGRPPQAQAMGGYGAR